MTKVDTVFLEATGVRFYSQYDESVLFNWFRSLPCVEKLEGRGLTLYVAVRPSAIDEDALRELLALFHRYSIEKRQLAHFDRPEFAEWFRDPNTFWFSEVFDQAD
nr:hypothetical protein [uncultured Roseateles sp.]